MAGNKLERELVRLRNAMEGPDKRDRATLTNATVGYFSLLRRSKKQELTNLPNRPFMWLNIKQENILASGLIL